MSRRYGRNQKRQAQARIAELEEAYWMLDGLHQHTVRQRDRLREQLDRVTQALGPNFIGLDPVEAALSSVLPHAGRFRMLAPNDDAVTMQMMSMRVTDAGDSADCRMHIRATLAGGDVAYAISESALRDCDATFLAQQITRQMAPALVKALRRNGARR